MKPLNKVAFLLTLSHLKLIDIKLTYFVRDHLF